MICTCNINNLKDMSPAFVNRFDVVVLENQLRNLNGYQYSKLISNIFNSFERIPTRKKELNANAKKILSEIDKEVDDDENNEENPKTELNIKNAKEKDNIFESITNKEDLEKKDIEFLHKEKNLINKIIDKIKILPENKQNNESIESDYSHLRTISAISRFCYGIYKLRKIFGDIKYENNNITDEDIINTVFDMIFKNQNENAKIEISENIKNALLKELIEENEKKMQGDDKDKYEKYFFDKSESLKNFYV